ncbi:MAG: Gfo/Idh/MocA family oxidoreductase [Kiritimatiellae bacterium]|nr:Gfo/Idh/MocA family oxidoreductase [Kiritimatiellia bacterium]
MNMTKRDFLKSSGCALAGTCAIPFFHIGNAALAASVARGRKIRIGLIGCGWRMGLNTRYGILNNFCSEEIVCMAEPDPPRWDKIRAVVKAHQPETDVTKIRAFYDYREMLDKMAGELDAVAIATPNHHHATAAILAMSKGLHVYVEKPMALTIEEAELMHKTARKYGVATQVGNHGHSAEGTRRLVEYVQSGALGQIHDVWVFNDRLNAMLYRPPKAPPPKGMDWDAWCGPAPVCDYYAPSADHGGLHPHDWHAWIGYGNGSLGNMGTHLLDPAFWALRLGEVHPESVEATEVEWGAEGSWAWRDTIHWRFPARKDMDAVTLHWFDGVKDGIPYDKKHVTRIGECRKREYQNLPPILEELERKHGQNLGRLGSIFVGEKGILTMIGAEGDGLTFVPFDLRKSLPSPPKTIPREKRLSHQSDWLRAIRNPDRPAGCNVDYSTPLAKTVLLGNVASRAGRKKLLWDGSHVTNDEAANAYLRTTYREGWELPK